MMQLGKVICFALSDGTLQYRDRISMDEIWNESNFNAFQSPLQAGFKFVNETPCESGMIPSPHPPPCTLTPGLGLDVALSPTNCSFAQLCEDGTVKWNNLHHSTGGLNMPPQGGE